MLMNTGTEPVASKSGLLTTLGYRIGNAPATYALEGSIAIAGALVQWLRDNLGLIRDSAEVETLARTVDDNGGVYFVPAFSGLFAPYWRSDARGVIAGLTRYVNRGHIARAVLEATAWQTREVLDAMNADSGVALTALKVDGGMVGNELLMQFQADVLGVPVIRPKVAETTALGRGLRGRAGCRASGARLTTSAQTARVTASGSRRWIRPGARRSTGSGRRPSRGPSIGSNRRRRHGCQNVKPGKASKASKAPNTPKAAEKQVGTQRLMARPRMMARRRAGAMPDAGAPPDADLRPDGSIRPDPSAPHVLIIGGGGTGGALAHDLTLRGLRVTLVERGEVTSGTTGRHHGLLHSGARYATTDRAAAIECIAENKILRRIAPGSFEENDGLFVAPDRRGRRLRAAVPRSLLAVRRPDSPDRPRRGTARRARSQPGVAVRGPGARRDDGRHADAAALLRHGPAQRRRDPDLHRGDVRDDGRTVGPGRGGPRPRGRPGLRDRRGYRDQRRGAVGGEGGGAGGRRGPDRALARGHGRRARPPLQHGRQSAPRPRRRRHRAAAARAVGGGDQLVCRWTIRTT